MTAIKRNAIIGYSAEQMFDLVNKIEQYPEFLPWCKSAQIHSQNEDEIHATLTLAKGGIEKSFSTLNRLQAPKMIEVRLVSGPFKHLEGFWQFESLEATLCKVSLNLEFEFGGSLLSFALGPIFHQIANSLVDAFCQRAKDLYG